MQVVDVRTVFSLPDLNDFLDCEHLTALDLAVARGESSGRSSVTRRSAQG